MKLLWHYMKRVSSVICRQTRLPGGRSLHREITGAQRGNEVPGYQVYIFRGLTLSGEVEIIPGLEIISYRRAVNRGLVE